MAQTITCPSCHHAMALPGSMVGPVTCSACGTMFEVPAAGAASRVPAGSGPGTSARSSLTRPAPAASASAVGGNSVAGPGASGTMTRQSTAHRAGPVRPPGSPPELLERLPQPFLTSPPMIAVGGVFVLLYGMVLFGAVNVWKNIPDPEPPPRPRPQVAIVLPPPPIDTPKEAPKKADDPKARKDEKPSKKGDDKPKSGDKGGSKGNKGKGGKPKVDKEKAREKARPEEPEEEKADTQVALNATVPKPPTLTPVTAPATVTWGILSGPPGDCTYTPDGEAFVIEIPGKLHVLSPMLKVKNAPRLLYDVGGDFTAQVQVAGKMQPGIVPLELSINSSGAGADPKAAAKKMGKNDKKDKKNVLVLPFTFQGAGLLLWKDPDNYVRFERTASYDMLAGKKKNQLLVEICREGKTSSPEWRDFRETDNPITLRIVRKGNDLRCSYSPDQGKTWLDVKRTQQPVLPDQIQVGISAANASPKPLAARFEAFDLSR